MKAEPLNHSLWRLLSNLRISRFQPTRRGKRAGQRKQRPISVAIRGRDTRNSLFSSISTAKSNEGSHLHIPRQNLLNIHLDTSFTGKTNNTESISAKIGSAPRQERAKVPNLMVTNAMSLAPKIDEVREFVHRKEVDLVFITETWLKEHVDDGVVDIPGFTVVRHDRQERMHGGVCAYIREGKYRYKHLKDLNCCDEHEGLWLHIRPNRLPRGFSCIIAAALYHPLKVDDRSFREHLFQSLSLVVSEYPNCGILVTGDFNRLDISGLLGHFRLKKIVKVPTRRDATLDLIMTNMHEHYSAPQAFPPFGLSDHNTVVANALHGKRNNNSKKTITKRDLRDSSKAAMGRYLNLFDWQLLFAPLISCEEMWNMFSEVVRTGLDILMPEKKYRVCAADPPWMTQSLKSLILKRQKAFNTQGPDSVLFRHFRNVVNRERKVCRGRYYESKVQQLKGENPRRWWDEVKRLSGAKTKGGDLISQINIDHFSDLSKPEQANAINAAFLEPLDQYRL